MGRRRSLDREAHWQRVISQQQASGQTIAAFCREQEISAPSFYTWRRRLAQRVEPSAPRFVPLPVNFPASSVEFEVRFPGGSAVLVPSGFDEASLRRLLEVVVEVERRDA